MPVNDTRRRGVWGRLASVPIWAWMAVAAVAGAIVAIGGFTFTYGQGYSYLGSNPQDCSNCHVMRAVYDAWNHSSHKAVAACNDCHTPHDLVGKYAVKAIDGFNHSTAFTLDRVPEPIHIRSLSRGVVLDNCRRCHGEMVSMIEDSSLPAGELDCLACHAKVGHDE